LEAPADTKPVGFYEDPVARARLERIGKEAVSTAERAPATSADGSAEKKGLGYRESKSGKPAICVSSK